MPFSEIPVRLGKTFAPSGYWTVFKAIGWRLAHQALFATKRAVTVVSAVGLIVSVYSD